MKIKHILFPVLSCLALVFASCESKEVVEPKTKISRPLGTDLEVFWTLKENNYKGKSAYLTEFVVQNNSKDSLKHNWAIYFHQPRTVDMASVSPNVKITHISGDYFKVEPSDKFTPIANGESVTFTYESNWWAIKLVDAPVGLYVVYTDANGEESIPEVLPNVYYDPMLEEVQTKRTADDPLKVPTPNSRFELNSKTIFAKKDDLLSLIPTPVSFTKKAGVFNVKSGLIIGYDKGLKNEAEFLMQKLKNDFKIESTVKEGAEGDIVISVSKGLKVKNKTTEAYNLDVTESKVTIKGSDSTGVFYGIQSLRNLIPVKAFTNSDSAIVKCISIQDAPRFDYRGMHLDVARNFQKKESVLKLIDLMSLYKLIWDDFCSWFLEVIKPAYGASIDRESLEAVKSLFEDNLRVLHPFMPFITEELWHIIADRSKTESLIVSEWPKTLAEDAKIISDFEITKQIIGGIRNFRKVKNLGFKEQLTLISTSETVIPYPEVISKLGQLERIEKQDEIEEQGMASFRINQLEFFIPIDTAIDTEEERKRLTDELKYAKGFLQSVEKKLSNERFVSNAPEQVIAMERKKAADAQEKITLLEKSLNQL